jgi:hypothetical protein
MCKLGDATICDELCAMRSHHGKSEYAKFCKGLTLTTDSSATSESWAETSSEESTSTGEIGGDGSMSRAFQFWMVATVASVIMAMAAVHMGQRKNPLVAQGIARGVSGAGAGAAGLSGAVGRRLTAVSSFADGVFPTSRSVSMAGVGVGAGVGVIAASAAAVEMSSYKLDDTDVENERDAGGVNPNYPPHEEGIEQSCLV